MNVAGEQLRLVEDDLRSAFSLYELLTGPHAGTIVAGPPGLAGPSRRVILGKTAFCDLSPSKQQQAVAKADGLLESLLTSEQAVMRRQTGQFWVDTPQGRVRLGVKYDLRHRPVTDPGRERSLCVVPKGWDDSGQPMPDGDFWVNLLLMLLHEPAVFFRVAIVRSEDVENHPCCRRCSRWLVRRGGRWTCLAHRS